MTEIQSVSRACLILQLLSVSKDGLSTLEVSQYLNLNRSTTHHLLSTLQGHDFVTINLKGKYALGSVIGEMANGVSDLVLRNIVHGILIDLVDVTGETSYLAVFNNGVTLIDTVLGVGALRVVQAYPLQDEPNYLHARTSGKLYLATLSDRELQQYVVENPLVSLTDKTITSEKALYEELEQIRKIGYSTDLEEYSNGIICLGFPIINEGRAIGCVTTSFPSARKDKQSIIMTSLEQALKRFNNLFIKNPYEILFKNDRV